MSSNRLSPYSFYNTSYIPYAIPYIPVTYFIMENLGLLIPFTRSSILTPWPQLWGPPVLFYLWICLYFLLFVLFLDLLYNWSYVGLVFFWL